MKELVSVSNPKKTMFSVLGQYCRWNQPDGHTRWWTGTGGWGKGWVSSLLCWTKSYCWQDTETDGNLVWSLARVTANKPYSILLYAFLSSLSRMQMVRALRTPQDSQHKHTWYFTILKHHCTFWACENYAIECINLRQNRQNGPKFCVL